MTIIDEYNLGYVSGPELYFYRSRGSACMKFPDITQTIMTGQAHKMTG
jgi:hypothetical protein